MKKQEQEGLPSELEQALKRHSSATKKMIQSLADVLIQILGVDILVAVLQDEINTSYTKVYEALHRELYKKGIDYFEVRSLFVAGSLAKKFTLPSYGIYPPADVRTFQNMRVSLIMEQVVIPSPELGSRATQEIVLPAGTIGHINVSKVPWKVKGIVLADFPVCVEFQHQGEDIAVYVRWESIRPA